MTHKALPVAGWNQPIASGTLDKGIFAVSSTGGLQTTSSSLWTEFFVPDGEQFNGANIRVGDGRPTNTDPEYVYENFLWCHVDPEVYTDVAILAFNANGMSSGIAKKPGESLGFFKSATTGMAVVLWARE